MRAKSDAGRHDGFTNRRSGFTLVEMLVVVVILAVLAGLAIPAIGGIQRKARTTETMSNLRQVYTLFIAYAGDHSGAWPAPLETPSGPFWSKDKLYPYLVADAPVNPPWSVLKGTVFTSPNAPRVGDQDNSAAPVVSNASNQGFGMNTHLPDPDQPGLARINHNDAPHFANHLPASTFGAFPFSRGVMLQGTFKVLALCAKKSHSCTCRKQKGNPYEKNHSSFYIPCSRNQFAGADSG